MKNIACLVAIIASFSTALAEPASEQPASAEAKTSPVDEANESIKSALIQQFEYLVKAVRTGESVEDALNRLGLEGWELVSVLRDDGGYSYFYFKRIKRPSGESSGEK
jgi:hypothetical protein